MTKKKSEVSAAVKVARKKDSFDATVEITLTTGVRARLKPVAASLIDEAVATVELPEIPVWHNPDKGRDEANPNDPTYIRELGETDRKRGIAAIDTMIMVGVELIDGLPEDGKWLEQLKLLEKRGRLDLSGYDLESEIEKEFVYKRYFAMSAEDLAVLSQISSVKEEDITDAVKSFRS
jgi:hypothetical protein